MATIGGFIRVVERRARVEKVGAAPVLPDARRHEAEEGGGKASPPPSIMEASTTCPLPERDRSNSAARTPMMRNIVRAAIVSHEIERRDWPPALLANGMQHTGMGEIGDVVPGAVL